MANVSTPRERKPKTKKGKELSLRQDLLSTHETPELSEKGRKLLSLYIQDDTKSYQWYADQLGITRQAVYGFFNSNRWLGVFNRICDNKLKARRRRVDRALERSASSENPRSSQDRRLFYQVIGRLKDDVGIEVPQERVFATQAQAREVIKAIIQAGIEVGKEAESGELAEFAIINDEGNETGDDPEAAEMQDASVDASQ